MLPPAEAGELLKFLVQRGGVEQFVALILPGLVSILVFDLRVPGERRKYGEIVLAIVVYSALLDLVGVGISMVCPSLPALAFVAIVAIGIPALIGWFTVDLREMLSQQGLALSPFPMAWDQLFRRLGSSDELYALVITLSDGRKVGGIYDANSFVSTFPADGDLLIGAPCEVDQSSGNLIRLLATSYGLYIKRSDVLAIEVRELRSAFAQKDPVHEMPNADPHGVSQNPEVVAPPEGAKGPEDHDSALGSENEGTGLGRSDRSDEP